MPQPYERPARGAWQRWIAWTSLVAALAAACGDAGPAITSQATAGPTEPPAPSIILPTAGVERAAPISTAPAEDLVAGLNAAGVDLWLQQPLDENLVFSPTSIGHTLLMGRAAANAETGDALDRLLGLPDGDSAHEAWNLVDQLISASADSTDDVTIASAGRIWPDTTATPDVGWIDLLTRQHGASVEELDLQGDAEGSRQRINDWIADQTNGLIEDLISPAAINSRSVLVLTDALYFEALWLRFFSEHEDDHLEFSKLDGSRSKASFMRHRKLQERHGMTATFAAGEIPYSGGEFTMLIIVPNEGAFDEVRNLLGQGLIETIDEQFTTGPYELIMPQWQTKTSLDLLPWLGSHGAAPGAYPSIHPDAVLSGAVHGADIAVDLRGTVAAASTALMYELSGPPEPELVLVADRPFLYVIRHRATGLILFAGQVTDPTN